MVPTSEQLKIFGRQVAYLRKKKGYSQEEFAEATGKMINTISNIERGLADPKFTTITAIASALQVNVADLFYEAPLHTHFPISDTTKTLLSLIENMPETVQQVALKQIEALSELKS